MKLKTLAIVGVAVFALQGCVIAVGDDDYSGERSYHSESSREDDNREYIAKLDAGANLKEIKSDLGTPDFSELLVKGDTEYRVLFYRTQRRHGDGMTTKDECTAVVFKNNALIGIGETALEKL
ncbi:DUF3192 domain-containing protein [Glaciecola sp. 1036]|uniref:DUF3192 domain-containing protein n=1 Tax=Alteromonadaceae TaxID=72275 RepID=UPI003D030EE0